MRPHPQPAPHSAAPTAPATAAVAPRPHEPVRPGERLSPHPLPRPFDSSPLLRYAAEGATGVLRTPRGRFYLVDGRVTAAEAPEVPGTDQRLAAAERIAPQRWRATLAAAAAPTAAGGAGTAVSSGSAAELLREGRLSRGELEVCHLQALLDAACCAHPAPHDATDFVAGIQHWLGPVRVLTVRTLLAAVARRRAWLRRLLPWPEADTTPLRARTSPASSDPLLPPFARALLAAADGRSTPYQLAHATGVSVCAVLLQARRLHTAGVLEPVRPPRRRPATHRPSNPPALPRRRAHPNPPPPPASSPPPAAPPSAAEPPAAPAEPPAAQDQPEPREPDLPDTHAPHPHASKPRDGVRADAERALREAESPDIALLLRLRDALEERL